MWTMGCSDCSEFNIPVPDDHPNISTGSGRKLRPLIPKPTTTTATIPPPPPTANSRYCSCLHTSNLFKLNDHLASSRWNPTPEQRHALEEIYGGGTRTPTAEQIQQIAAELRQYGKVEGKNVFYWFQNHKARERQKRRRTSLVLDYSFSQDQQACGGGGDVASLETKEPGLSGKGFEEVLAKNRETSSNCSSTLSQEFASAQRAVGSESGTDGWIHQLEGRELQLRTSRRRSRSRSRQSTNHEAPFMKLSWGPNKDNFNYYFEAVETESSEWQQPQTLQLFPRRSDVEEEDSSATADTISCFTAPLNQYFEFLPLKN